MHDAELALQLMACGSAGLCNVRPEARVMDRTVVPRVPGTRVAGRARTVRTSPGDNAAVHRAVGLAQPGDVLVVDGSANHTRALFGGLLAESCLKRGLGAAVIRGSVRDIASMYELAFPLWSSGIDPRPARKAMAGELDVPVLCGGIAIRPGDWVVADDDGVVSLHVLCHDELSRQLSDVMRREKEFQARIAAGESTCKIFGIAS